MNIFAIDLGNKRVKMKSERGEYVYPASYLDAETVTTGALGTSDFAGNQTYRLPDEDSTFIWGTDLEGYNVPEKLIDTYTRTGRYTQKKAKRLLEFAIARLALDFPEAREAGLKVRLVLGLALSDAHADSKVAETLKALANQKHRVFVDGVEVMVDIVGSESTRILPQFMGTVFNAAYDDSMHTVDEYKAGYIGVVDIGGGTVVASSSNAMNPSPFGEERFEGIQTLIKAISQKANITKPFLVEELLRSGSEDEGYIYRPNRNARDAKDISRIVLKEIENYTRLTIAPLITEAFPDLEAYDFILMTGGGSNLIDRAALLDEVGEEYFAHIDFEQNAELANVRGFYKAGRLIWEGKSFPEEKAASPKVGVEPLVEAKPAAEAPKAPVEVAAATTSATENQANRLSELLANIEKLNSRINKLSE